MCLVLREFSGVRVVEIAEIGLGEVESQRRGSRDGLTSGLLDGRRPAGQREGVGSSYVSVDPPL